MAPSISFVAAMLTVTHANPGLDESSMLQLPLVEQQLGTDEDECRCPGYYREQCEAEASQGCVWSDAGSSNAHWCQCIGTPFDPPVIEPAPPTTYAPPAPPVIEPALPTTYAPPAACPPSVGVLSNDHSQGPIGKYFNFNRAAAEESTGEPLVNGQVLWAASDRNGVREVKIWTSANGGSVGDCHGRLHPHDEAAAGDWQVGDHIMFAAEEGVDVLSNDHSQGDASIGKYFNFNLVAAARNLGRPLVSGEVLWVRSGGSWRQVIVWDSANGGSVGNAHGRLNEGAAAGDWEVGDHILFARDSTVEVLSNDHSQGDASIGKYFNFNRAAAEESLSLPLVDGEVLWAVSERFGAREVKIWTSANGGSVGDCHGRLHPHDESAAGDWQVGDLITLLPFNPSPPSFDC